MEFKKPKTLKRYSDEGPNSPLNRKKCKLLSTTIATPEPRKKETDPFDDNFSQFFRSQFIRQISDAETSIIQKSKGTHNTSMSDYNFTQIDGLSQFLDETQFERSITSGQRCITDESSVIDINEPNNEFETDKNENWQFTSQFEKEPLDGEENEPIEYKEDFVEERDHGDNGDKDPDSIDFMIQSSQAFLKELSVLQTNISSICNDTINASKFDTQDFLNPDQCQFEVFKSHVTESQYMHRKRPNEQSISEIIPRATDKKVFLGPSTELNTETIEDQLLAEMVLTTQALAKSTELLEDQLLEGINENDFLDDSEQLNECIDPDSSALNIFSDEDDKENHQNATKHNESIGSKRVSHNTVTTINRSETLPVTAAKYCSMGPFFGLPLKVKKLIRNFKNIDDLYDWQKECLQLPAIEQKKNLIYALPTSGGKTLVSEILIFREILCRQKSCIFILPYVSIVQEKVWSLSPFALELGFLIEEYAAGKGTVPPRKRRKKKSVYIATIEKALVMFDSLIEAGRVDEIGLVIIDELHIIGESGRGATLEALLTKIQYVKAGIQIVGMSATIGNLPELAEFLDADVYQKDFRPVELREYIKCGSDLVELKKDADCIQNAFVPERTISFNYKADALKKDPDHVAGLVSEVIPTKSCLIFCSTKKNCESLTKLLCTMLPKKFTEHKIAERENLIKAIENDMGSVICPILGRSIMCGIAYHHSGLTTDERRHLEEAFRCGVLCVICCTSTLAAGVNLPAKRVIIRSPYVGREFITLSKYKQMVGRAGRAGFGESGESILLCNYKDNQRVCELLCSPMDEVISQMPNSDSRALEAMILSAIGLNIATTQAELQKLVARTMFSIQSNRFDDKDAKTLTNSIIVKLIRSKAVTTDSNTKPEFTNPVPSSSQSLHETTFSTEIDLSQRKRLVLKSSTRLQVEMLGKSSFKSGIDFNRTKIVYTDLQGAQKSLVLLDYFHLLYIVTPYDEYNPPPMPDRNVFYKKYYELDQNQLHTAKIIGIAESTVIKLMSGQAIKPEHERVIKKFFMTMVLNELWHLKPVSDAANSFGIDRGIAQNLMGMAAIEASCLLKFCEELEEFWAFRELFKNLSQRLSNICTVELVPLMQLPSVKMGRAKQLYNAGYKKIEDVARAKPKELVDNIEHMTNRLANQLVSAAKVMLLEKLENLQEEAQECMEVYLS
ncbi:helicase POLQ-like [Contarinia nasturtii]|uniref:helicase POLQ-like n=1 Tax=Contarinia nasturtii TaxID=265458 RepID=UPI0012D4A0DD|nr:helicase POLQ-like [Contarinia nasturtii]XP_031628247.1 helicase POLQ-like [Contarinia nasturtii]XP_031628248.1 helicase POLQ-like [Contarinia nasturtii]